MDFFAQQAQAQRQTRTLLLLFVLAVLAIVGAVNVAMALILTWTAAGKSGSPQHLHLIVSFLTIALIGGGSAFEIVRLREGGDAVARMAGGELMPSAPRRPQERVLQNVVEEMAIASGIACPRIYVLQREAAINAFAAGFNQNEAVIAVTRGALERLNRDELQGVIGHEFSHVLNGDMRLNMRLIGVLFGIEMIAGLGRELMDLGWRSRSSSDKGNIRVALVLGGAALYAIGYIGVLFGRLIKSAVSRQREFLADASAIQFTRNPDGIGNALRKIGGLSRSMPLGSRIDHPQAEQLSHFFLCAARPSLLEGLFATHPGLSERLRRIYGRTVGLLDAPVLKEYGSLGEEAETSGFSTGRVLEDLPYFASDATGATNTIGSAGSASFSTSGASFSTASVARTSRLAEAPLGAAMSAMTPDAVPASRTGAAAWGLEVLPSTGSTAMSPMQLPPVLRAALHDPLGAGALAYALLLDDPAQRAAQLALLVFMAPQHASLAAELRTLLDQMPDKARLPLLDLAMPALKMYSQPQRQALLSAVAQLIASDQRVTLEEFVLETILERRLAPNAGRMVPVRYDSLAPLAEECAVLLSLVANVAAHADAAIVPAVVFDRANAIARRLGLRSLSFQPGHAIAFDQVKSALARCNQLAPLAKPALVKMLVAGAGDTSPLPLPVANLLYAICTAIDVPMPPVVIEIFNGQV